MQVITEIKGYKSGKVKAARKAIPEIDFKTLQNKPRLMDVCNQVEKANRCGGLQCSTWCALFQQSKVEGMRKVSSELLEELRAAQL